MISENFVKYTKFADFGTDGILPVFKAAVRYDAPFGAGIFADSLAGGESSLHKGARRAAEDAADGEVLCFSGIRIERREADFFA